MLKRIVWILVFVLVAAALWWFSRARPADVDVAIVERGPIRAFVEEEGRARVIERYVLSAPVGGRLLRVVLEEGDPVGKDAVVAHIDPLPLESRVSEVRSEIAALRQRIAGVATKKPKAEEIERARLLEESAAEAIFVCEREREELMAGLERAVKNLKRTRDLFAEARVPEADLDAAVAEDAQARERVRAQEIRLRITRLGVDTARLNREVLEKRAEDFDWEVKAYEQQVAGFEATLASLQADLSRTEITSPIAGTVLRVLHESEQVLTPGAPILEVADLSKIEIEADFLSEDAAHMRQGMPAEVFGRALRGRVVEARVKRIEPSAFEKVSSLGVEQQRVYVILEFDPEGTGLGDGYRVEVRVILDARADVVLVPEGALFRSGDAWHVFIVENGEAQARTLETGLRDGRFREVLSGLDGGETVILHPDTSLEDGARVRILER